MLRPRSLLLVCALLPATALAAPADTVHALHQQITALQVDHALNLTKQQAQALVPLLEDARAKVAAAKAQRASSEPALVAALTQAVADLKSTGTVSAGTVSAVQTARNSSRGALRQELEPLVQAARQILTSDQLQALKSAPLGIGASSHARGGPSGQATMGRHHFARRMQLFHALLSDDFLALVQARAS